MLQPAYDHLIDPNYAKNNYPKSTYAMLNTFFLGASPVITAEQIAYIGQKVDEFMSKKV